MIIDCFSTDKFAVKELADRMGDNVVSLSDVLSSDSEELFSEKPFVFAVDYDFCLDFTVISRFMSMKFTGSKVLYIVYVNVAAQGKTIDLAKRIAAAKKFVLFGVDDISHARLTKEEYFAKIDMLGERMRNVVPFDGNKAIDFPYGATKSAKENLSAEKYFN